MKPSPVGIEREGMFWAVVGLTTLIVQFGTYFTVGLLIAYRFMEPAVGFGAMLITAIAGRMAAKYCHSRMENLPYQEMELSNRT
jgi:hypothetical protein